MTGRRRQAFINSAVTRGVCPALVPFGISIEESVVLEGAREREREKGEDKREGRSEREERGWRGGGDPREKMRHERKRRIDTRASERTSERARDGGNGWIGCNCGEGGEASFTSG